MTENGGWLTRDATRIVLGVLVSALLAATVAGIQMAYRLDRVEAELYGPDQRIDDDITEQIAAMRSDIRLLELRVTHIEQKLEERRKVDTLLTLW